VICRATRRAENDDFCSFSSPTQKTKIGLTVAKARKHENKALASEASKLISKWKKLVASPKQMSSSPDNGSASDPKESLKQEANGNGQKHETQGGHQKQQVLTPTAQGASSNGHPQSNTTPKQTNTTTQTSPMPKQVKHKLGDATRQRVLEMLTEGLGQAQDQGTDLLPKGAKVSHILLIVPVPRHRPGPNCSRNRVRDVPNL